MIPNDRERSLADLLAKVFPHARQRSFERMTDGGSTEVYRVDCDGQVYYLRVLPEQGAGFAPEALVHQRLGDLGALVPEVIYVEHRHPILDRSVMITTAIPGVSLNTNPLAPPELREVLLAAGRDLARIHSLPVVGFGWVRRDEPVATTLSAEQATRRTWVAGELEPALETLSQSGVLSRAEAELARSLLVPIEDGPSLLAHGDFDPTHIFHHHSRYSGLIDFGEIRGAEMLYDLGHFGIESGQLLPDLLAGYQQIAPLPHDAHQQIAALSLRVALIRLGRFQRRRPGAIFAPDLATIRRNLRQAGR